MPEMPRKPNVTQIKAYTVNHIRDPSSVIEIGGFLGGDLRVVACMRVPKIYGCCFCLKVQVLGV